VANGAAGRPVAPAKREPVVDLRSLQNEIDTWVRDNGGYWDEMSLLARLMEEVGEVSREYNHRFGAKRKKASEPDQALQGELADVLWIVLCMANQQGIDLQSAFDDVMHKVRTRDAGRFPPPADPTDS
jgi:NTP pyrophosphatase (non-canonical NTP hydrolase)